MSDRGTIPRALKKFAQAKTTQEVFRRSLETLLNQGELPGFSVAALPEPIASKLQGFDLNFADRCIRMIFTASSMPKGQVAIGCFRAPLAHGIEFMEVHVYEVDKNFCTQLPDNPDLLCVLEPVGVYDLLSHLVETVVSSRV